MSTNHTLIIVETYCCLYGLSHATYRDIPTSTEFLKSLGRNAFDPLRDNTETSDLHLHTQASHDSKSQGSRLHEIMFKWMKKAIKYCHWLDRLNYDLKPIISVIFHMVLSIRLRLQPLRYLQVLQSPKRYLTSSQNWYWFVRGSPQA